MHVEEANATWNFSKGCPFQNTESYGTGSYFEPVPFLGFGLVLKKNCKWLIFSDVSLSLHSC